MTIPTDVRESGTRAGSWWGDRGVTTKVLSTVALGAVVTGTVGLMGVQALGSTADSADSLYEANLQGAVATADVDGILSDIRVGTRNALLSATPQETQETLAAVEGLRGDFDAAMETYAAGGLDGERQEIVDGIDATMADFVTFQDTVLAPLALANDVRGWTAANDAQGAPLVTALTEELQQLREL
jgi:hypothetical protein